MLPLRRHVIASGELLDELHIRCRPRTGEDPFEEIVTQESPVRHAVRERRFECIDVVDAFSRVRALTEEVLIHIRDGRGVRIDTRAAREHALEQRATVAPRKRSRHARLQNRVALHDAPVRKVQRRAVERMRHLSDESTGRVPRQPRIRVECQDVANVRRNESRTFRSRAGTTWWSILAAIDSVHAAFHACVPSRSSASRPRSRVGDDAAAESEGHPIPPDTAH